MTQQMWWQPSGWLGNHTVCAFCTSKWDNFSSANEIIRKTDARQPAPLINKEALVRWCHSRLIVQTIKPLTWSHRHDKHTTSHPHTHFSLHAPCKDIIIDGRLLIGFRLKELSVSHENIAWHSSEPSDEPQTISQRTDFIPSNETYFKFWNESRHLQSVLSH